MTRAALCLVLLVSAGCVSLPWNESRPQTSEAAATAALRGQPRPLVLPEQITSDNAHALSQALWDELDVVVRTPVCGQGCPHCQGKP